MSKQALAMSISILAIIIMFAGQYGIIANNIATFGALSLFIVAGGVWAFYKPANKS